ncbi:MAG: phosphoglucosamine mutase [Verrucomicrobia bacterium]|nr:phosphoglucosamine mutase [Verrucomicrobiota bacterium]
MSMKRKNLFGTDGVRGRANHEPMTVEVALALGRAAGTVFRRRAGKHRVVIGKDTRLSGYMFENALVAGLCSMGVDTLMVGPLPTPGVAYITRAYRADAGIVISASHNPYFDNGIKFFSPDGFKLEDGIEWEIEAVIREGRFREQLPADDALGKNFKVEDAQGRYIEFVKATFPRQLTLGGMRIVLDCANGASYRVAPLTFQELGAEVKALNVQPNGLNINLNCGALHPEAMAQEVIEQGAHVGIALDGDGDRVILADEGGRVIDGDMILAIFAKDMARRKSLAGNAVVGTLMTNLGVIKSLAKEGISVVQASVGDRHVIAEMRKSGLNLGGEQNGHIMLFEYSTTDDGLMAALQVLRIMVETGKPLSELASFIHRFPQRLINIAVREKPPLENLRQVQTSISSAQKALGGEGRVLVRYSGTERICRVMVEGENQAQIGGLAESIAEAIQGEIGH